MHVMVLATPPNTLDMAIACRIVGNALGTVCAFGRGRAVYFELGGPWLLRLSPDSAGRFRVSACYGRTEVASLWCLAGDRERLAALARELPAEIAALAA